MVGTMFFLILTIVVWVLILQVRQKIKQIDKQLRETERVTDRTRVMVVSGEHLNKKKEMLLEVHGAHVASLENESNLWSAKRRDYESAIHKQTKVRKKKIRRKKRKGR